MELEAIYQALDGALPTADGNPCGRCNACCTGTGLSVQHVLGVELDTLARLYGAERAGHFEAYTERRRGEDGSLLHDVCPFFDAVAFGCGIYAHRPFACRLFGHYRMEGTTCPEGCVFQGRERVVAVGRYFQEIPQAVALRELDRAHASTRGPGPSSVQGASAQVSSDLVEQARMGMNPDDPLDMAVLARMEGRLQDALRLFQEGLNRHPESAWGFFQLGELLDHLELRDEAARAFRRAIELEPGNATYRVHLGFNRMESGRPDEAREAFAEAVRLQPDHAVSQGFLGLLWWMEGNAREAQPCLERAVTLDPDNPYFRLRLAETLWALGRPAEAEPHLEVAAAHPHTAPHVEAMRRVGAP